MQETRITIIGLGGAGCRILEALAAGGSRGPVLAAVHTQARSLGSCGIATRVQIGVARTRGLGTGGDIEAGRKAAEEDRERWRPWVRDRDVVMVVTGLGGGTGTGAAPVILRAAREERAMALCLATLPMDFEGRSRRDRAESAVPALLSAADALILVPNDRLVEHVREPHAAAAFREANRTLGNVLDGLWKLLARPGYLALDFADLQTLTRGARGAASIGHGEGRGRTRAAMAIETLLASPLLDHGKVLGKARAILVSIAGGEDLTLKEVGDVMASLSARAPPRAEVFMGTVLDPDAKGSLRVTVVAAEQWAPPEPAPEAPAPAEPGAEATGAGSATSGRPVQGRLKLEGPARGRFQNAEPTIHEGQDLDIPTFLRRGISIEF